MFGSPKQTSRKIHNNLQSNFSDVLEKERKKVVKFNVAFDSPPFPFFGGFTLTKVLFSFKKRYCFLLVLKIPCSQFGNNLHEKESMNRTAEKKKSKEREK